jgi:CBS domain-containing protein
LTLDDGLEVLATGVWYATSSNPVDFPVAGGRGPIVGGTDQGHWFRCGALWSGERIKRTPVTKVMSAAPTTIQRGQPISVAYEILNQAPFHHLPVLDGDAPVGVLSSTDILRLAYDLDGTDERTISAILNHQFTIDDAMTAELSTLPDTATIKDAAEVLCSGTVHSVIVLDENNRLGGIVTTTDLVQFLHEQFR